jgi:hypothetical protein
MIIAGQRRLSHARRLLSSIDRDQRKIKDESPGRIELMPRAAVTDPLSLNVPIPGSVTEQTTANLIPPEGKH